MVGSICRFQYSVATVANETDKRSRGCTVEKNGGHKCCLVRQYSHDSKVAIYLEGDKIWVSRKLWRDAYIPARPSAKLEATWFGPLTVLKLAGENAVNFGLPRNMRTHFVVHVGLPRLAMERFSYIVEEVPRRAELLEAEMDETPLF